MSDRVTFSKVPKGLPWREEEYNSTIAALIDVGVFYSLYLSAASRIRLAMERAEVEPGEARPSQVAIFGITQIVEEVSKTIPLSEPEVSVFHGEAVATWKCGAREISLLSRGNANDPKLMQYEAGRNQPSGHQIYENAAAQDLKQALSWLYE